MSIRDLAWDVGALAAALALGLGVGYVHGDSHGVDTATTSMNKKVLTAQRDEATAEQNAKQANGALAAVKAQLATQQQELVQASQRAAQALKDRQLLTAQLAAATRKRLNEDRKALHEKDCMALDSVPVCPVLAHRLFDQPAEAGSAGNPAAGH